MRPDPFVARRAIPRSVWKKVILTAVGLGLAGTVGAGIFVWQTVQDLPDLGVLREGRFIESSKILDRDGNLLYEIHGEERRTLVGLGEMAGCLRTATLAAEDDKFYSHFGFRPTAILRSIWQNLRTGSRAGGSTITQQLVKNAVLQTREKTYTRKIRELILAVRAEIYFEKDEILEMYLNQIPYGSNAYGVEAAAQTFFRKSARDLTLPECAMLAALPQRPSFFSPYGQNVDRLLWRKDWVLERMARLGYISADEATEAKLARLAVYPFREKIIAPHFVFWVRDILTEKYGEDFFEQGGITVTTTLDPRLHDAAREAIAWRAPTNEKSWGASNAALTAIDPRTGEVLAMVGSKDYFDQSIDGNVNVALRRRQPGSSFKPFIFAAGIDAGVVTPGSILYDVETSFPTPDSPSPTYTPQNYDEKFRGPVSVRAALGQSLNVPAVKILSLVGLEPALDFAKKFGFAGLRDAKFYGLSLVLGGAEVRLLDQVSAYGTFANGGVRHPPVAILKVQDSRGRVLEEFDPKNPGDGIEVISPELAYVMANILSDNPARTPAYGARSWLQLLPRPVAAKTGTTENFRDGWTVGFTPSLVAGVWVGNNDNEKMYKKASGGTVAAPIWQKFMKTALDGSPIEHFKAPDGVRALNISALSGKLPGPLTPPDRIRGEIFLKDHLPTGTDDRISAVEVNARSDTRATVATAPEDRETWVWETHRAAVPEWPEWQDPVDAWAAAHRQTTDADIASLGDFLGERVRWVRPDAIPMTEDRGTAPAPAVETGSATPPAPAGGPQILSVSGADGEIFVEILAGENSGPVRVFAKNSAGETVAEAAAACPEPGAATPTDGEPDRPRRVIRGIGDFEFIRPGAESPSDTAACRATLAIPAGADPVSVVAEDAAGRADALGL